MQKTKLGISIGLLGATVYFAALFSGHIPLILIAGYILLFEENSWLKRAAIKAVAVVFSFALLNSLIGFIPNAIDLINSVARIFSKNASVRVLDEILNLIGSILSVVQKIILLVLALKALTQGEFAVGFVDNFVRKHTGGAPQMGVPQAGAPQMGTQQMGTQQGVPHMAGGAVCKVCGATIPGNAAFCVKCGNQAHQ